MGFNFAYLTNFFGVQGRDLFSRAFRHCIMAIYKLNTILQYLDLACSFFRATPVKKSTPSELFKGNFVSQPDIILLGFLKSER
jgi:hypothetical protein